LFAVLALHSSANASGITLNVIEPHEYALPVNYESFNAVVQYGYVQDDHKAFDNSGDRVAGPGTYTAVGLTKYVRFFTFKPLPNVGLAWEVIQPEISVQKTGVSATGLGDTITGFAGWMKPGKNSTLGIQSFLQIPIGTDAVSDKTWKNLTSAFGDVQLGDVDIDGNVGFVVQSDKHETGKSDTSPGSTLHANLRVGYRAHQLIEPFLAADYQTTGSTKDLATGLNLTNSASNETTVGGGAVIYFADTISLTARYDYGVEGKNTPVTNAINFKFAYIW
jgi:hypothetical protein